MIKQYSNLISKDYILKIVFYNISKDFIKRFNNISFNQSFKNLIVVLDSGDDICSGDIIFIDENFFSNHSINEILGKYKFITFIAKKFDSDRFKSIYKMGVDNIIYDDFIDAEIKKIYSYVHSNITNQIQNNVVNEILDNTTNIIVITDEDGNIEYVNKSFINSSGYSYEEALGENPRLIKSNKHPKRIYEDLWDTILSNKTWEGDFINLSKDGDLIYEEAIITPIKFQDENNMKFIKIANNINKQKFFENKAKINISLAKNIMSNICDAKFLDKRIDYNYILKYSHELGGDFVRFDRISEDKYLLSLVDVTGHDLSSTLIVMSIYSIIRQYDDLSDLSNLAHKINDFLYNFNSKGEIFKYATGIFVEIDLKNLILKYINTGHPAGICFDNNDNAILLSHNSSMLGVIENDYEPDQIDLRIISHLMIFSDGILDIISHDYDVAEKQLLDFLKSHQNNSIDSLKNHYINDKNLSDDLTFAKVSFN
jgi:sigma-B regulation protein RsbU (phosphoserine phosphatase)